MSSLAIIGICILLAVFGALSTDVLGPNNEVEQVTEHVAEDEMEEVLHIHGHEYIDPEQPNKENV